MTFARDLKRLQLNQKSPKHPLINSELKAYKIRLKFTKKLSSPLR